MPRISIQPDRVTGLCGTCENALAFKTSSGLEHVRCHVGGAPIRVPHDITWCTDYQDRRRPSKWEMEKVAWTIKADKQGRVIGFDKPEPEKKG